MSDELQDILAYWMKFTIDKEYGGFAGRITHNEITHPQAPKGSVLNSRILWSFSAAYNLTRNDDYLGMATRAYNYLLHHFVDKKFGGVYWTVDYEGNPLDTKKQIYALAFAVYGFTEYYKATQKEEALQAAIELYHLTVKHSYDNEHGGYIEALSRDWQNLDDLRLSAKDANERKSMNTHLHVLEGFANLYAVWPNEGLKEKLTEIIQLFLQHIISGKSNHLVLFFADDWLPKSDIISYGHDIEAAWLVQEAAEILSDEALIAAVKNRSLQIVEAAAKGLDNDGGLWYEYDAGGGHLIKQKHSWPQAEAMVGFFNAWQISGNEKWLQQSLRSWRFVQHHIKDKNCGEWVWGVNEDYSLMDDEDKVGLWKCPYHNSRACMEIVRRIDKLLIRK